MQTRIVALFFAVLLVHVAYATLNPKRVHIVDHDATTNNFLFRGNMPKNEKNEFALADLKTVLAQKAKEELNVTQFPSDFYLVDVSFLNSIVEGISAILHNSFCRQGFAIGGTLFCIESQCGTLCSLDHCWKCDQCNGIARSLAQTHVKRIEKMGLWPLV